MSKSRIGVFSPEDAALIHQKVLGRTSEQPDLNIARKYSTRSFNYYVKMLENLAAATDPETGYTQAEGLVVRYVQPISATSLDRQLAEDIAENRILITNRSTSFSAGIGDYIWVQDMGSEYAPMHSGGGQNSAGDECGCDCDPVGDFVYNNNATVYCWSVALDEMVFVQNYGTITLPAGNYTICFDSNRNVWVKDIGDFLTAKDINGIDVTAQVVLDGEIVFEVPMSGTGSCCVQSELSVCVTGTIPQPQLNSGISKGTQYGFENGFIDGYANAPYDDRVVFAGSTGTASGTGAFQQFGTGTYLAPGTGTYGEDTGTGTGTGTFMWSDYEEGFYQGYKSGYADGYSLGNSYFTSGTGWNGTGSAVLTTESIAGTGTAAGTGVGGP